MASTGFGSDDEGSPLERNMSITSSLRSSTARRRRGFNQMRDRNPPSEWEQTLLDLERMQHENKIRLQESSVRREGSAGRSTTSPAGMSPALTPYQTNSTRMSPLDPGPRQQPAAHAAVSARYPTVEIFTPNLTPVRPPPTDEPAGEPILPRRALNLATPSSRTPPTKQATENVHTAKPRDSSTLKARNNSTPAAAAAVQAVTRAASYRTQPAADAIHGNAADREKRSRSPLTGPVVQPIPSASARGNAAKRNSLPQRSTTSTSTPATRCSPTRHQAAVASPRPGMARNSGGGGLPARSATGTKPQPQVQTATAATTAATARRPMQQNPATATPVAATGRRQTPATSSAAPVAKATRTSAGEPEVEAFGRRGSASSTAMSTAMAERRRMEAIKARRERDRKLEEAAARNAANARAAAARQNPTATAAPRAAASVMDTKRSSTAMRPAQSSRGVRRSSVPTVSTDPLMKGAAKKPAVPMQQKGNTGGEEVQPTNSARAVPFCTDCGKRHIDAQAKFCAFCGHKRAVV